MNTMKCLTLLSTTAGLVLTTRVVPVAAQVNVNINFPSARQQPVYVVQPPVQYIGPVQYVHPSSPRSKHNRGRYGQARGQYVYPQSRPGVTISF